MIMALDYYTAAAVGGSYGAEDVQAQESITIQENLAAEGHKDNSLIPSKHKNVYKLEVLCARNRGGIKTNQPLHLLSKPIWRRGGSIVTLLTYSVTSAGPEASPSLH
uniref:Uncharacterized protein n=1 Tax=Triticum urartu TaxID=4572 RepID=A0A8R7TFN3_TRIUA